ncbi:DUF2304 domain-containing protein [Alicyclobacillus curvatus]|nr:DUF2304 domain-containing protein [Alicyclobacillus curvatus]
MIQVLSVFFSLVFLLVTIYVVRRRQLHFGYAILWLTLSLLVLVLALRVKAWNALAHQLGVYYAPALIFLVAILFVMVYLFQLTITVTRLSKENVQLAQEVAMLKGSTLLAAEAERGAVAGVQADVGMGVQADAGVGVQFGAQARTGVQVGGPAQTGVGVQPVH